MRCYTLTMEVNICVIMQSRWRLNVYVGSWFEYKWQSGNMKGCNKLMSLIIAWRCAGSPQTFTGEMERCE
jgi:hypothetical protein